MAKKKIKIKDRNPFAIALLKRQLISGRPVDNKQKDNIKYTCRKPIEEDPED